MQTKNAIGNLINRYRSVLKKCNLLNTFGTLAVAGMIIMGSVGVASAAPTTVTVTDPEYAFNAADETAIGLVASGDAFTLTNTGSTVVNIVTLGAIAGDTIAGELKITGAATSDTNPLTLLVGGMPGASVTETLTVTEDVTITGNAAANSGGAGLTLGAGGTFTATAGTTVAENAALTFAGGTHDGNVTLTTATSALMVGIDSLGITAPGTGTLTGALNVTDGHVVFVNGSTLNVTGAVAIAGTDATTDKQSILYVGAGSTLKSDTSTSIDANAIMNLGGTHDGTVALSTDTSILNADGTAGKIDGTLTVTDGMVAVATGTALEVTGNTSLVGGTIGLLGTHTGNITATTGAGTLVLSGGTVAGAVTLISGDMDVKSGTTNNVTELITLDAGAMVLEAGKMRAGEVAATTTLNAKAGITTTGGTITLNDKSVLNVTGDLTSASVIDLASATTNLESDDVGATVNVSGHLVSTGAITVGIDSAFNVTGTVSTSANTTIVTGATFVADGTVTLNAVLTTAATTIVDGTFVSKSGTTVAGVEGAISTLTLDGTHTGNVTLNGAATDPADAASKAVLGGTDGTIHGNLLVTDGTVTADSLTVNGNLDVTKGSMTSANLTVNGAMTTADTVTLTGDSVITGTLGITGDVTTVATGNSLSTAGTTIANVGVIDAELVLGGTHTGNVTLNGAAVTNTKLTAAGTTGTVTGDLLVTKGTVTLGTGTALDVTGNMTIADGSALTIDAAGVDLTVGNVLTLASDYTLAAGSLTAKTIAGKKDIIVTDGKLTVDQNVTLVAAATDAAAMEFVFTNADEGTINANAVNIDDNANATRTVGHIIADSVVVDNDVTASIILNGATGSVTTTSLTFKADKASSDLGANGITLTGGTLNFGEARDATIAASNAVITDADMEITVGAAADTDTVINVNDGTFSINALTIDAVGTLISSANTVNVADYNAGTLKVTDFIANGDTTVSKGATLDVTNLEVATGKTLEIDGATVVSTTDSTITGKMLITNGVLDLGDEIIAADRFGATAAADGKIGIAAGGTLKTNALTLTGAKLEIAGTLEANTIALAAALEIDGGTLQVNGGTIGQNLTLTTGGLTLGDNGGTVTSTIAAAAGAVNVTGAWVVDGVVSSAEANIAVTDGSLNLTNTAGLVFTGAGNVTLDKGTLTADLVTLAGGALSITDKSTLTTGALNAGNGAITVTDSILNATSVTLGTVGAVAITDNSSVTVTGALTSGAGVNAITVTDSNLTVGTLTLTDATDVSTLTATNSTVHITGAAATDFANGATADSVKLISSTLKINDTTLLLNDTTLNADIAKIAADAGSTVHITGATNALSIVDIKAIATALITAPGDGALIKADNFIIDAADLDATSGYISSAIINNSNVDVTGQAGKHGTVFVATGAADTAVEALTNFAANGLLVQETAVTAVFADNLKIVGNNILTYTDANGVAIANGTGVGKITIADEGTLTLVGATDGDLNTVTLTDATANTTNLVVNGSYDITNITGTTMSKNNVNVKGGDLDVTNLTNATVNAVGGDLEVTNLDTVTVAATTNAASIEIDTVVQGGTLTFGDNGSNTVGDLTYVAPVDSVEPKGAFANVVNATIGKFAIGTIVDTGAGNVNTGTTATLSEITVGHGGMLAFGMDGTDVVSSDWIATSMNNAGLVMGSGDGMIASAFGVVSTLDIRVIAKVDETVAGDGNAKGGTAGQSIKVGTGATAAAAGDAGFGSDSLFVVNAGSIGTGIALTGANINVDAGAKLLITNVALTNGKAKVAVADGTMVPVVGTWGYQDVEGAETLMFDNVFLKVGEGSKYTTTGVDIEIEQVLASDAFGSNLDSALGGLIDNAVANNLTTKFVDEASHAGAKTVEGGAKLGTVAGIAPSLNAIGNAGLSNVQARNSIAGTSTVAAINYSGDTTQLVAAADGANMANGIGVWAMPMYKMTSASDLESGSFQYGYDTSFFGVSIGADYTFDLNADSVMRLGATFNTGTGTTDSTGDFAATTNDFSYFGVGIYGTYQRDMLGVTADFGYTSSSNDITQNTIGTNLTADPNASLMSFGVRGEYLVPTATLDVVPYLGLRWNSNTVEEFNSSFKGETAFGTNEQTASVIEIPLGVSLRKEFEMDNKTTIVPKIDLGVKFAFGDLDTTQEVTLPGVTGTASMDSTAMDAVTFQGGLGVAFKAGAAMSFDVDYKLEVSSNVMNNGIFGTFRYTF